MIYKENADKAKARLQAFWAREIVDRCCFSVVAGKGVPAERRVPGTDAERLRHWTDPDAIISRNRSVMQNTYYGADAMPTVFLDLGAAGHAGFFHGARHFFGDSVWFFPSLTEIESLCFDENSFLYQKTLELARAFAADSHGDYLVSMPDCSGNIDALSHLMGPENLMAAMVEEPEAVEDALQKIQVAYESIMQRVYEIVRDANGGGSCIGWLHTWAQGKHAQMQSDMSVMISNALFERFVMPELTAQCDFLDYPLYHFDGIEQIRHLDSLLSIRKLRAIQWTQVAGQPPVTDFIPELKKIQAAGKGLLIQVSPDQIEKLMSELSSRGLYLLTSARTPEHADELTRQVVRMTHD